MNENEKRAEEIISPPFNKQDSLDTRTYYDNAVIQKRIELALDAKDAELDKLRAEVAAILIANNNLILMNDNLGKKLDEQSSVIKAMRGVIEAARVHSHIGIKYPCHICNTLKTLDELNQ